MQFKRVFILMASLVLSARAQEQVCRLLSTTGEIQIRAANELRWEAASDGRNLQDRETIRSGKGAGARIQSFDGKVFMLPENAQIEISELRALSRDEAVLQLTAIEVQRLPARKDTSKGQPTAFILHGEAPESAGQNPMENAKDYQRREEHGAMALFEQGYLAGFIVKWNRLVNAFPGLTSERAEAALINAYETMGMPFRAQQARQRFQQRWPKATLQR